MVLKTTQAYSKQKETESITKRKNRKPYQNQVEIKIFLRIGESDLNNISANIDYVSGFN